VAGRGEAARVRSRRPAGRATDREVGVVAAVLVAGSEKAAAHRLGRSHSTVKHHLANARSKVGAATTAQLVWILGPRLPEPDPLSQADESRAARRAFRALHHVG
jgi:DNA-binding NarL/FixJ family response regulator